MSRGTNMIILWWVESVIAAIILGLRFGGRYIRHGIGLDDWLMLVGYCFLIAWSITITIWVASYGGGGHIAALAPSKVQTSIQIVYVVQNLIVASYIPTKASVGALIIRIMKPLRGWRYYTIVYVVGLSIVLHVADLIITWAQCIPSAALWDKSIMNARCWNPDAKAKWSIAVSSYNVFVDVFLAVLPATILFKLETSLRKKISLAVLLGLGLFSAICGIIKVQQLHLLGARTDITYDLYDLYVWGGTETFVLIVCGSVPPIKVLWDLWFKPPKRTTSNDSSTELASKKKASKDEKGHSDVSRLYNTHVDPREDSTLENVRSLPEHQC